MYVFIYQVYHPGLFFIQIRFMGRQQMPIPAGFQLKCACMWKVEMFAFIDMRLAFCKVIAAYM